MQREDPLLTLERTCALPFFKNPCGIFANYVSELTLFLKPKPKIYQHAGALIRVIMAMVWRRRNDAYQQQSRTRHLYFKL